MTAEGRTLTVGDVVTYDSERRDRHCREGQAVAKMLFDTFWGVSGDQHILSDVEAASARLVFSMGDYEEIGRIFDPMAARESRWERYAPEDRQRITSQHGLQARYFVRKGAQEDMATQIVNAERRVAEAKARLESALESAEWSVKMAERDLAALIAPARTSVSPEDSA